VSAAIRLEVAHEKVAELSDVELNTIAEPDECWRKAWQVGVPFHKLELIIKREQFKRGLLKLDELTPNWRRKLVDPSNLDLHAIAAGPIMDAGEIYLPAGKLSMAETKAREFAQWSKA
jgi:hypothetical protein